MKKSLLLFIIPILLISTNVFATETNKNITKTIVVNKLEENDFFSNLEKSIVVDNIKYNLEDIQKQDLEKVTTKVMEQTKTIEISTNNKDKILEKFEESINYNDGDFSGTLYLCENTLNVTTIKHGIYEKIFTINKEYTGLDKSDLDYIPKEIKKDGYTYSLTQCDWTITENKNIENVSIPKKYTAHTTYKTVKILENPYTYNCKITYIGDVNRASVENVQYTVIYKQEEQKEKVNENKISVLPYLGCTGIFLVVIFFLVPNAKIMNYYNRKYQTIKHIRVSAINPKVNLKHLTKAKTNAFSIKFNNRLNKRLAGKSVTIITPKATYKKMIINKTIEVHL